MDKHKSNVFFIDERLLTEMPFFKRKTIIEF